MISIISIKLIPTKMYLMFASSILMHPCHSYIFCSWDYDLAFSVVSHQHQKPEILRVQPEFISSSRIVLEKKGDSLALFRAALPCSCGLASSSSPISTPRLLHKCELKRVFPRTPYIGSNSTAIYALLEGCHLCI